MDATQAAALLTYCASFDNRKPDADIARAWAEALDGIDFTDARAATTAHYRTESRWIMPSDVIRGVKQIERARIAAAPNLYELTPPKSVTDLDGPEHDAAYLSWLREQSRRVRRGLPLDVEEQTTVTGRGVRELVGSLAQSHRES